VVLCGDEKAGVQALGRTQPLLPLTFDESECTTKHGRVNLFGSFEAATVKSPEGAISGADQKSFSRS
jgi:hypothetical protein